MNKEQMTRAIVAWERDHDGAPLAEIVRRMMDKQPVNTAEAIKVVEWVANPDSLYISAHWKQKAKDVLSLLSSAEQPQPVAWITLDCVKLQPSSVTLDKSEIEEFRPEHIVPLYADPVAPQASQPVSALTDADVAMAKEWLDTLAGHDLAGKADYALLEKLRALLATSGQAGQSEALEAAADLVWNWAGLTDIGQRRKCCAAIRALATQPKRIAEIDNAVVDGVQYYLATPKGETE